MPLKKETKPNQTMYPELLTVVGIRWNKLPGCWLVKDKKNSPLIINNY